MRSWNARVDDEAVGTRGAVSRPRGVAGSGYDRDVASPGGERGDMSTVAIGRPTTALADGDRLYLLVVAGDASWMQPLPSAGVVVIGRVAGCEVQLDDTSVSRQHARIELGDGRATVVDLGSQNGTLVNNQRVERRDLVGGDVLTVGTAVLVFHGPTPPAQRFAVVGADELRTQLGRELDRVVHYGRVFKFCFRERYFK